MQFKRKYSLIVKIFLFQAIQFSQTVLIQTIQFSISMQLVLTFHESVQEEQFLEMVFQLVKSFFLAGNF